MTSSIFRVVHHASQDIHMDRRNNMTIFAVWILGLVYFYLFMCRSICGMGLVVTDRSADFNILKKRQNDDSSSHSSSSNGPEKRKSRDTDKNEKNSSRARLMKDKPHSHQSTMAHSESSTQNLIDRVGLSEGSKPIHLRAHENVAGDNLKVTLDLSLGHAIPLDLRPVSHAVGNSMHHSVITKPQTLKENLHRETGSVKPFSSDVLRHTSGKRPVGYDTNEQTIARFAEKYINSGTTTDDKIALRWAKFELDRKRQRKSNEWDNWRRIAGTDPSKAREMGTIVPKRLSKKEYVPLRAHQLDHQGKAPTMEDAIRMATTEHDDALTRKREYKQAKKADKEKAANQ
jgi:hypothetical protein